MVKLSVAVLAALAASASAFAPQKAAVSDSALAAKVPEWKLYEEGEVWDPLNLAMLSDGQAFDTFPDCFPNQQFVKEAEIKHGRMAMLAWTGVWATSDESIGLGLHFPGFPEAHWENALGVFASEQPIWFANILVFIAICEGESVGHSGDNFRGKSTKTPGDLNFDYLGIKKRASPEQMARYEKVEMKNGRAAMIAMASLFAFKAIPGSVPFMDLIGAQ